MKEVEKSMEKLTTEETKETSEEVELQTEENKDDGVVVTDGVVGVVRNKDSRFLAKNANWENVGVPENIRQALADEAYDAPSKIQAYSLPHIFEKKHLIGQSHNGSGKTLAFCIGLLNHIDADDDQLQGLILVHTREMVDQIGEVIEGINKYKGVKITPLKSDDKKPVIGQVAVSLMKNVEKLHKLKRLSFKGLKIVAVDEADFFCEKEEDQSTLTALYKKIDAEKPDVQKLFFSATYPPQIIEFLKNLIPENAIKIELPKERLSLAGIKQFFMLTKKEPGEDKRFNSKLRVLKQLVEQINNQVVIFVNTRVYVTKIFEYLTEEGYTVHKIMGGMDYAERDQVMRQFRAKQINILLSTNLLSRGIDIPNMNMVVNFDPPCQINKEDGFLTPEYSTYLHRIGRTGRFDTKGVACTLIGAENADNEMCVMNDIKDHYQMAIDKIDSMDDFYDVYRSHVLAEDLN